ncbi:MAG: hypothetical protein WCY84_06690 [Candidatus Cloacimonadaceae bacterium]
MKRFILFLVLLAGSLLFAGMPDTLFTLPMPQFCAPYYDFFARNYIGSEAAGRGYTGLSIPAPLPGVMLNPATLELDKTRFYLEAIFKPAYAAEALPFSAEYHGSDLPLGIVALGFPLGNSWDAALSYSCPQSLILKDFSVEINQGAGMVVRRPTQILHQATGTLAWQPVPQLRLGLNLINQWHYIDDHLWVHSWDRQEYFSYNFRLQPGLILGDESKGLGLSGMPPTPTKWELRLASYEYDIPWEAAVGGHYSQGDLRLALDMHYQNTAQIHEDFKDHYSLHLGLEKAKGVNTYRAGYLYSSDVYSGYVKIPINPAAESGELDPDYFWEYVNPYLKISDTAQHFLGVGYTRNFRRGNIYFSAMHAFGPPQAQTQLTLGLNLHTSTFFNTKLPDK